MTILKIRKLMMPFGMAGVILFFTHTILGRILRPEYNPITSYISELTAKGAPYSGLLRTFMYTSNICLFIFSACMATTYFKKHGALLRIGFCLLLISSVIMSINSAIFPLTIDSIMNIGNYIHHLITNAMISNTILSLMFITEGYNKQRKKLVLGIISTITLILFVLFNILHLAALLGLWNVLGLIQRLSVYTFYLFMFELSRFYTKNNIETSRLLT